MWESFNILQKIFFCIAVPATLVLIVQIIMMLIGFGHDTDVDFDGDGDADISVDTDSGLTVFTVRGIVAFFTIGGWIGFTFADTNAVLAIILAVVAGTAALVGMAFALKAIMKLQSSGNLVYTGAVGKHAEVYLTIPAKRGGKGKISITLQESLTEMEALTDSETPIKTGEAVKVTGVVGSCCIVERDVAAVKD